MNKGILFDLDGTLWDATYQMLPAWNRVLVRHGMSPRLTISDMQGLMGKTVEQIAAIILPELTSEEGLRIVDECCKEELIELGANGGILYPDVEATIARLAKRYRLFIVSNCQDGYIQTFLKMHGFESVISDYESYGKTGRSKGENILLVMRRNGIERACYLGDTQSDADAAFYAGIPFVHASYGFGSVEESIHRIEQFALIEQETEMLLS
ncbi:MAG: HAD family hydrolase [Anaerofustis sp.]